MPVLIITSCIASVSSQAPKDVSSPGLAPGRLPLSLFSRWSRRDENLSMMDPGGGNALFILSTNASWLTIILQAQGSWHQTCDIGRSEQFRRRSNDRPQSRKLKYGRNIPSWNLPVQSLSINNLSSISIVKISWAAAELTASIKMPRSLPCFHRPRTQHKIFLTAFYLHLIAR